MNQGNGTTSTLGDHFKPRTSKGIPSENPSLDYLGLEHIESHTGRVLGFGLSQDYKSSSPLVEPGDVLYGRLRPYLNKVAVAPKRMYVSGEFIVFPPSDTVDSRFLQYLLMSPDFLSFTALLDTGDRPRVSWDKIAKFEFLTPSIKEQRRIFETLDDHLGRLDKALVEIQRQKPKVSVAYQELIDRIYWEDTQVFVPLRDFGDWVTGSTPSTKNPSYFGGEIPFVTPPEVKNSQKVITTKRTLTLEGGLQVRVLEKPSIHLVCIGTVGKLGFSEGLAATNQQITSLVPSPEVDFNYALDLFSSREAQGRFRKASGKSNMPMLAKGSLLKVEMPLPSLEIQKRLKGEAESLRTAEAANLARFQAIENQIVQLRRAILHSAFQGKLGILHG